MGKLTTSDRLNQIMRDRNLKQVDILDLCRPYCIKFGVKLGKNDLSQYVSGKVQPGQDKLTVLGAALNVNEVWLMGYNVPSGANALSEETNISEEIKYDNVYPIETRRFPLLGEIACGEPIFANEDRESYIKAGTEINADFCLRCKGDSMRDARILDGDIVFIRKQSSVDNGEIAAVIINDEATLKRVYFYPQSNKLVLNPANPSYEPLVFVGDELNQVRILGLAVAFQSDVK